MVQDLHNIRQDYGNTALDMANTPPAPMPLLENWLQAAAHLPDYQAMVLSTVDAHAQPSARVVLLKQASDAGLDWYTNKQSEKGQALSQNPRAALCFFWQPLHRQIRVQGKVIDIDDATADAYFASRPRGSQISAAVSLQSQSIENRDRLESRVREFDLAHTDKPIPRPATWGGFRLVPQRIEFWQGRDNRLHDRIVYTKTAEQWQKSRLQP